MGSLGVVALIYSDSDAFLRLRKLLESAGFTVVSARVTDVAEGRCDLDALMKQHDPSVVVYDVGPSHEEHWGTLQQLRGRASVRDRRFVITAVNASQVEALAGSDDGIYEVVDTENDLGEIVKAVKEAARAHVIRAEQPASNVTTMPERRQRTDRRLGWTPNEEYAKLREKREAVEFERRHGSRRAADQDPNHSHAA